LAKRKFKCGVYHCNKRKKLMHTATSSETNAQPLS
jgi:hypothetical protein